MMNKQLLIVDDEERLRELVQACLEDLVGWKTIATGSGKEAIALAQTCPIDAILLDVSMPDMDGFAVYEQLQAHPVTQAIPVILLTAKVLPSDRARFAAMGIAGVIAKPFNPLEIGAEVAEILGWSTEF
ncbi:response regulator [Desertifilum sp. FACHB-1129]|uniref:Two-component system response regulator n=2 Tax=Desertifilum tharense IPPAS B-1220 TaxID=1781255 RepID=A0A1E5QD93_9CYAN|nr:response regulator [Desertifilum sp. FACHB-1129]MBD2321554.1 response regulator [Desertifilum sp. FACHB-866]MBD2331681.1 response regulator [Desertifilum sp. FACHB-868]MDA0213698.1 response regulator [Cyanobacteria bacterium FC1]OEJ72640.1 two-component system response regulator [Desertifilum tharense IPPAS B-1220]